VSLLDVGGTPTGTDVYVAMTHYQILVATALTLWRKRPARLYVLSDYLDMPPELADAIRATGVFVSVVFFSERPQVKAFYQEMDLCHYSDPADIGEALHRNFDPLYEGVFAGCSPDDLCFVFNEGQHYYYYIEGFFTQLIKVEDGYRSFPQELRILRLGGKRRILHRIEGRDFPVLKSRSAKIRAIVVSEDSPEIPAEYGPKLRVMDIHALFAALGPAYRDVALRYFNLDTLHVPAPSVLILTQPLARAGYCTRREQVALFESVCRTYAADHTVFVKPHPADKADYGSLADLGATILDKGFPIDLFEYTGVVFDLGVTFGSTALRGTTYVKEAVYLFDKSPFTADDVHAAIMDLVGVPPAPAIGYHLDAQGDPAAVAATLASLLRMRSAGAAEIVLTVESPGGPPPGSTDPRVRVLPCEPGQSLIARRLAAAQAMTSSYIVFTSPGFTYARNCHREAMACLRAGDYDCVSLGLCQRFRGRVVVRRQLGQGPLELEPYFLENKVIRRSVVLRTARTRERRGGLDDDFLFYVAMLPRCRTTRGTERAVVDFEGTTPFVLNWPGSPDAQPFEAQERACAYLYGRYVSGGRKSYVNALIGVVYWLMPWANQTPDQRARYEEFLRTEPVTATADEALRLIRARSAYVTSATGAVGQPKRWRRVRKVTRFARQMGFRQVADLLKTKGFRRKVYSLLLGRRADPDR